MSKLLFLDIDGVLNCHEWDKEVGSGQIHEDKIFRLNRILRETNAKIVLSSAWRYLVHRKEMNLVGLDWLLRSHGLLKDRLKGITRADTTTRINGDPSTWVTPNERGLQIHEYIDHHVMCGNELGNFCVLDDLDLGITTHKLPFVQTNSDVGLQDGHVHQVIRILNAS